MIGGRTAAAAAVIGGGWRGDGGRRRRRRILFKEDFILAFPGAATQLDADPALAIALDPLEVLGKENTRQLIRQRENSSFLGLVARRYSTLISLSLLYTFLHIHTKHLLSSALVFSSLSLM